jgi:hypothetical protein
METSDLERDVSGDAVKGRNVNSVLVVPHETGGIDQQFDTFGNTA